MNTTSAPAQRAVPRLSIGVPVYNEERYIELCLRSILEQTYGDFEIIVCDNASTDRTCEIVQSLAQQDPRIVLHRAPRNLGASANFNWAVTLARGELFKWCAADDLMHPALLQSCIDGLDATPDAVLAFSGAVDIDAKGELIGEIYDNREPWRFDSPNVQTRVHELVCRNHSCIAVFGVIRRSALLKTKLIGSYTGSDRTLLLELGLQGKLIRTGDDLLLHREHERRSVRQFKELQERTVWFDTSAKGRAFPAWRLTSEYLRAITVCGQPFSQKIRCFLEVARFLKWYQAGALLNDVRYHLATFFSRRKSASSEKA